MKGRLTLDDFKLNHFDSHTELEKMMGMEDVAAACHETCVPDPAPHEWLDCIDHEQAN